MLMITTVASDYIKKILEKEQGVGFRLSVKKTGCSGFSYVSKIITQANTTDLVMECVGIKVFIDPVWAHLYEEVTLDYIEEEKAGLKQKRLVFINPKESARCGCGESFHIE